MFIDLDHLSPEYCRRLHSISSGNKQYFADCIDTLEMPSLSQLERLICSPSTRNTFASELYLHISKIDLVVSLLDAGLPIQAVGTRCKPFARVLRSCLIASGHTSVIIRIYRQSFREIFKGFFRPGKLLFEAYSHLKRRIYAIRTRNLRRLPATDIPLVLVGTFIYQTSFQDGQFKDRHFPGLFQAVPSDQQLRVWFFTTFYKVHSWFSIFLCIRKSRCNFLVKEDFLTWSELFKALVTPLFAPRNPCIFAKYRFFDVTDLVNDDFNRHKYDGCMIEGRLNYLFAKRLKENGYLVNKVVDWYENQSHSRGTTLGFHTFFPDADTVGYLGISPLSNHCGLYPTRTEYSLGAIPKRIGVVGKGFVSPLRLSFPDLPVFVAPALRFRSYWTRKIENQVPRNIVLVTLPAAYQTCVGFLRAVASSLSFFRDSSWSLVVKRHPSMAHKEFSRLASIFLQAVDFALTEEAFFDILLRSRLLISTASSTCVESLMLGVPCIMIGDAQGLVYNPIPQTIDGKYWKLCFSPQEVKEAIHSFLEMSEFEASAFLKQSLQIREMYFEQTTDEKILSFVL